MSVSPFILIKLSYLSGTDPTEAREADKAGETNE